MCASVRACVCVFFFALFCMNNSCLLDFHFVHYIRAKKCPINLCAWTKDLGRQRTIRMASTESCTQGYWSQAREFHHLYKQLTFRPKIAREHEQHFDLNADADARKYCSWVAVRKLNSHFRSFSCFKTMNVRIQSIGYFYCSKSHYAGLRIAAQKPLNKLSKRMTLAEKWTREEDQSSSDNCNNHAKIELNFNFFLSVFVFGHDELMLAQHHHSTTIRIFFSVVSFNACVCTSSVLPHTNTSIPSSLLLSHAYCIRYKAKCLNFEQQRWMHRIFLTATKIGCVHPTGRHLTTSANSWCGYKIYFCCVFCIWECKSV